MIVVGLTGSIAMGKSDTAAMFQKLGVPVFDSDAEVHRLYSRGAAAVEGIAAAFPGVAVDGAIDRAELSRRLADRPEDFTRLEAIVHPLVRVAQQRFLADCGQRGEALALLDIPLLFESGRAKDVNRVVVVTAPPEVQRARALARPGMTEEKLAAILARQLPDAEKRRRADFVVDSSRGHEAAFAQVGEIVDALRREAASHA